MTNLFVALGIVAALAAVVLIFVWLRIFGRLGVSRVIAAGLTVMLKPETVTEPLRSLKGGIGFISTVPGHFWASLVDKPQEIPPLVGSFLLASQFNLVPVLIGLALWAALAQLLDLIFTDPKALVEHVAKLADHTAAAVRRVPVPIWRSAGTLLFLMLGAYMIILSISAIPYLQDYSQVPGELRPETVKQRFQSTMRSQESFNKEYPELLAIANPLSELPPLLEKFRKSPELAQAMAKKEAGSNQNSLYELTRVEGFVGAANAMVAEALANWPSLRSKVWSGINQTQSNFDWGVQSQSFTVVSPRERADNLALLLDITQRQVSRLEQRIRECRSYLQQTTEYYAAPARDLASVLKPAAAPAAAAAAKEPNAVAPAPDPQAIMTAIESAGYRFQNPYPSAACQLQNVEPNDFTLSVRTSTGQGMLPGVRTLLETQSIPFVTIWGMLGAGLLGSALALMRISDDVDEDLTVPALVFGRSFVTAILLYLVVKGGLVVVGTNNTEPNAYFLLALCLIGTVFSDDIWVWARARLKGIFPKLGRETVRSQKPNEKIPAANTPPEPQPGPSHT